MNLLLAGPGRIGAALVPGLQAQGHTVTLLTRQDYGDFLAPAYDLGPAVETVAACDALLLLAGRFALNAPE